MFLPKIGQMQIFLIISVFLFSSGTALSSSGATSFYYEIGYNHGINNILMFADDGPSGFVWDGGKDDGKLVMGTIDSIYGADPGQGYSLTYGWYSAPFLAWNGTSIVGVRIPIRIEHALGSDVSNFNLSAMLKLNVLWVLEGGFGLGLSYYSVKNMPQLVYSKSNWPQLGNSEKRVVNVSFDGIGIVEGGLNLPFSKLFQVGINWFMSFGMSKLRWERSSYEIFIRVTP